MYLVFSQIEWVHSYGFSKKFRNMPHNYTSTPQNDKDVSLINYFGKEFVDMLEISSWTFLKDPSHKLQYKIPTVWALSSSIIYTSWESERASPPYVTQEIL